MVNFGKEELLKLAHLSSLHLDEKEVTLFTEQLKTILDYIDVLQQVKTTEEAECVRNRNVFREDTIKQTNSEKILAQAPQKKETYFSVPKILD